MDISNTYFMSNVFGREREREKKKKKKKKPLGIPALYNKNSNDTTHPKMAKLNGTTHSSALKKETLRKREEISHFVNMYTSNP